VVKERYPFAVRVGRAEGASSKWGRQCDTEITRTLFGEEEKLRFALCGSSDPDSAYGNANAQS